MSDTALSPDELKARLKKLSAAATQAKMDLHDLSEELPKDWERIPEVAQRAFEAHRALMQARQAAAATGC
ncbi:MAG: hypothetical protein HZB72_12495 [Burkholderiales bacterium]|nr:hypothetical protein [Burkholderiales bacterium]MCH2242779.1 hypothetical protein [Aquabacterium sp.]